jgi:hypothetical protein
MLTSPKVLQFNRLWTCAGAEPSIDLENHLGGKGCVEKTGFLLNDCLEIADPTRDCRANSGNRFSKLTAIW